MTEVLQKGLGYSGVDDSERTELPIASFNHLPDFLPTASSPVPPSNHGDVLWLDEHVIEYFGRTALLSCMKDNYIYVKYPKKQYGEVGFTYCEGITDVF